MAQQLIAAAAQGHRYALRFDMGVGYFKPFAFSLTLSVIASTWVLALSIYGSFVMIRALVQEESYLSEAFPTYESYQAKTARLIPFIY